MKRVGSSPVVLLSVLLTGCAGAGRDPFPDLAASFGQHSPGSTPQLFAPGVVSTTENLEIEGAFTPSMEEFHFVRQRPGERPRGHVLRYIDGEWHESIEDRPSGGIFIAPDGETMHLGNTYRERTESGWSEERSLGPLFDDIPIMRLTISAAGTYVFDEREEIGTIRYSRLIGGVREEPRPFGEEINSGRWTAHPFIAPDESYIIWDSERDGGFGKSDLYISFRQQDGSWGPATNLGGEVNTEIDDTGASVTPDGRFLFFNRAEIGTSVAESEANIFWVDARVIETLRER